MKRLARFFLSLVEGLRFWRSITPKRKLRPTDAYLHWRLGTVYGSFHDCACEAQGIEHKSACSTGKLRSLSDLVADAKRDRKQVFQFLGWRREMMVLARRPR